MEIGVLKQNAHTPLITTACGDLSNHWQLLGNNYTMADCPASIFSSQFNRSTVKFFYIKGDVKKQICKMWNQVKPCQSLSIEDVRLVRWIEVIGWFTRISMDFQCQSAEKSVTILQVTQYFGTFPQRFENWIRLFIVSGILDYLSFAAYQ